MQGHTGSAPSPFEFSAAMLTTAAWCVGAERLRARVWRKAGRLVGFAAVSARARIEKARSHGLRLLQISSVCSMIAVHRRSGAPNGGLAVECVALKMLASAARFPCAVRPP